MNEEKNGIINVHVTSSDGKSCFTDKNGDFNIEISEGDQELSFQHINYITKILNDDVGVYCYFGNYNCIKL